MFATVSPHSFMCDHWEPTLMCEENKCWACNSGVLWQVIIKLHTSSPLEDILSTPNAEDTAPLAGLLQLSLCNVPPSCIYSTLSTPCWDIEQSCSSPFWRCWTIILYFNWLFQTQFCIQYHEQCIYNTKDIKTVLKHRPPATIEITYIKLYSVTVFLNFKFNQIHYKF